MQVKVHQAKTQLSKLIEAACRGEEVIIARGDTPMVKLVPVERKPKRRFALMADKLKGPGPDWFKPMDEEDLALWEGRGEDRF